jgi:transcriptional regulator with XRE-family HTH domain
VVDHLASRIRQARLEAGLSQEQLARELGCSPGTVFRNETGRTKQISFERLVSIAKVTGQPLEYFMDEAAA